MVCTKDISRLEEWSSVALERGDRGTAPSVSQTQGHRMLQLGLVRLHKVRADGSCAIGAGGTGSALMAILKRPTTESQG